MKVVVLDGYALNPGDLSWSGIEKFGDCTFYDRTPPELTIERAKNADVVTTNKVIFDKNIIRQLPNLKYIGVLATGYNVVDVQAAKEAGITVTNIPAYSTASVAQMVFSHILNFAQNVSDHANSVSAGDWAKSIDFAYWKTTQIELVGKTLGIIGFGQIGQAVAKIGLAFGMKIIFNNRSNKKVDFDASQVDLENLLAKSDFISINCPLTAENKGFINTSTIEKMKPTAFLINTGRGPLINEQDLADALNAGKIAGAGLDVLSVEPATADNPLPKAKNCFITPHIAWATFEARTRLMNIASENLKAFIEGKPKNVVS
ncbi:MAG: D-2-hydroxyacid dehydrogenase [Prolixibacteraceae bacterium]|jgi:glycerate dehydrogenase|nr:D-2-hydroxyacid dehydrogenase [Prolixibacteraceae bacterium]MBT6763847.1 D-2-hydroxyacid dehydrogenase [Prolixibacteraceae bacterium]MBT7000234.1 D-2-hydroxyacid dehydrogenase [Prolixibacteraceae bacterium]MBT7393646.1 D-2-hydroxyacid dehydrogenase [Prolixibacteraceae bacterium]